MITTNKNRNVNFFLVAALGITLILTFTLTLPTIEPINIVDDQQRLAENQGDAIIKSLSANAFPQYRQSEWHSSTVSVTGVSGSEMYRQSERTLIPVQADISMYQLSEHTLIDPTAGLSIYLLSERTSTPVRNLTSFNQYQISEWFGT